MPLALCATGGFAAATEVETGLSRVEAIKAVERLQYAYGYYQNRFLFAEPPTLFSTDHPEVHYDGGVWVGTSGVKRLWQRHFPRVFGTDGKGPRAGVMFDQPVFQPVIDIAPDGTTAKARFQTIGRYGVYGKEEQWIGGVFENDYVKEAGVWKIKVMRYCTSWSAPYNRGWKNAEAFGLPWADFSGAGHPDRVEKNACPRAYPDGGLMAFHFVHPVTGKPVTIEGKSR